MMTIKKLLTLGCSLTHHIGWADYTAKALHLGLTNLATSASSNHLQIKNFQNFLLNNELTDETLIIWQITGIERLHIRKPLAHVSSVLKTEIDKFQHPSFVASPTNTFDNVERVDFLCHSKYAQDLQAMTGSFDVDIGQRLEDLMFAIINAKKHTDNIVIIFGWELAIPAEYLRAFKHQLDKYNVLYLETPILEWCKDNNLTFLAEDNTHPTTESYEKYCDGVLLPFVNQRFTIN